MFLPFVKVSIYNIKPSLSELLLINLKSAGKMNFLYRYVAHSNARAMIFGGKRNQVNLCLRIWCACINHWPPKNYVPTNRKLETCKYSAAWGIRGRTWQISSPCHCGYIFQGAQPGTSARMSLLLSDWPCYGKSCEVIHRTLWRFNWQQNTLEQDRKDKLSHSV